jgi:hypothetical protein
MQQAGFGLHHMGLELATELSTWTKREAIGFA